MSATIKQHWMTIAAKNLRLPALLALVVFSALGSGCGFLAAASTDACSPGCEDDAECVLGRCISPRDVGDGPGARCVVGSNSGCNELERCLWGRCVDEIRCTENGCEDGFTCGADGFCYKIVPCSVDADCDDGRLCTGVERCNLATQQCELGTPPCDSTAPYCVEETGVCQTCKEDAHCGTANYCDGAPRCEASGCVSVDAPDCGAFGCDANNDVCYSCNVAADCVVPGGDCEADVACEDNQCRFSGEPCAFGCDFTGALSARRCFECTEDSHCDDGDRCTGIESCGLDNRCVVNAGTANPCTDPDAPNCQITADAPFFECAQCENDGDCQDGRFCNGRETCNGNGECRDADNGDRPCRTGNDRVCDEDTDTCVFCLDGGDCSDGDSCTQDVCVDKQTCSFVPECGSGEVCEQLLFGEHACGECNNDNQCPDNNFFCDGPGICQLRFGLFGFENRCRQGGSPCDGLFSCDESNNRCVECFFDGECLNINACDGIETCNSSAGVCQDGQPVMCEEDETCLPITGACTGGED